METLKKKIFLSLNWILNTLDVFLQFFGIKLVRLTKETVYNSLTPEEIEETQKPDVAVPFQKYLQVSASEIQKAWKAIQLGLFPN